MPSFKSDKWDVSLFFTTVDFFNFIEIKANIIVGADGVESKIGKWAGIKTSLKPYDLETCAQYTLTNINYNSNYCEFYLGKKIAPGGYIWIFPKGENTFNVGISILSSLSDSGLTLKLLNDFINKMLMTYCFLI